MDAEDLSERGPSGLVPTAVDEPPVAVGVPLALPSGDEDVPEAPARIPWWWPLAEYPGDEEARRWAGKFFSALTVVASCGFVFWIVSRGLFLDTTPTGGDMGAHVWGPAYLRDELLPHLRVTGWSPDWYAGFPAYTFYMVVPSLAIVALDVGVVPWWLAPLSLLAFGWLGLRARRRLEGRVVRALAVTACAAAFVLTLDVPYNVAFKLVAVTGVVLLPAGVWYLARGLGLRAPAPELMCIASVYFLVDKTLFSILGGNIASTMAGEFSFSLSFTASLFFLGVAARGMADGRRRVAGTLLLALTALCHVIPTIYLVVAGVPLLVLVRLPWSRAAREVERANRPAVEGRGLRAGVRRAWNAVPLAIRWIIPTGVIAFLVSLFWYVPFIGQSTYLNDMGWEKYGWLIGPDGKHHDYLHEYLKYLYPVAPHTPTLNPTGAPSYDPNMLHGRVFFILAGVGVVLSLLLVVRAGIYLSLVAGVSALGFWLMPQARFWNARILPIYYLCVYLMAALGAWLVIRAVYLLIVGRWGHPPAWIGAPTTAVAVAGSFVVLLVSMQAMPGGGPVLDQAGNVVVNQAGDPKYEWGPFTTFYKGPVRDWVAWNFDGYENKPSRADRHDSAELEGIRRTMTDVGEKYGCGRAFWEYEPGLNRFGTPMALMLLPYWTKSCIGSMEGLYFEASATTPFHFAMQGELSASCSCAQRPDTYGLTYGDVYKGAQPDLGIQHLQMLGVKYFMATSDTMKQAAEADGRLRKVASTGPWDVYEVSGSELVVGLDHEPAVWSNVDDNFHSWGNPAMRWYLDPSQWDVEMAATGDPSWKRVRFPNRAETRSIEPATPSRVRATRDTISFDVDQVGKPVLVKTSFFPNWVADGARGPYRVTPNLMVVIPTSKHVTLTYGRTPIEVGSMGLSAIGLILLLLLLRRPEPEGYAVHEWIGDRDDLPRRPADDEDDEWEPFGELGPGDAPELVAVPGELPPAEPSDPPVPIAAGPPDGPEPPSPIGP